MSEYIVRETGYPGTVKQEIVGELVRCKDCRWRKKEFGWNGEEYMVCAKVHNWGEWFDDDFFCADGERKDDE